MPERSHVSISVLFQRQEPKRFIGSLRGYVPHKKRLKKPPDLLGSVLPKCAHSLRTQDQGGWRVDSSVLMCVSIPGPGRVTTEPLFASFFASSLLQSCPCFRVHAPVHKRPNEAHCPTQNDHVLCMSM